MSSITPWPVRSVVFDLDGLMIDTEPIFAEAARRLLARRGRSVVPGVIERMIGMPAKQALPFFREQHQLPETVEELATETSKLFAALAGEAPLPLLPGVLDLMDRLERRGIPKAIATSSGARYVNRVLGPHHVLHRFAFVLTSGDVRLGKPYPEIYEKAAARFGHAAGLMVVLEDSPNGLRAAKTAGARCIVVPHALISLDELTGADAILPSLESPRLAELLGV